MPIVVANRESDAVRTLDNGPVHHVKSNTRVAMQPLVTVHRGETNGDGPRGLESLKDLRHVIGVQVHNIVRHGRVETQTYRSLITNIASTATKVATAVHFTCQGTFRRTF